MKLIEQNQIEMSSKILNIIMNLRYLILWGFIYYNENWNSQTIYCASKWVWWSFRISVLYILNLVCPYQSHGVVVLYTNINANTLASPSSNSDVAMCVDLSQWTKRRSTCPLISNVAIAHSALRWSAIKCGGRSPGGAVVWHRRRVHVGWRADGICQGRTKEFGRKTTHTTFMKIYEILMFRTSRLHYFLKKYNTRSYICYRGIVFSCCNAWTFTS
jgi:hypothetical protein